MKTRLPPSLSVRGEEEFNPTLSGRSRQSPGAPSLKHLLWKQKICGKKIRCCSVSTDRSSFVFKSCKQEKTHMIGEIFVSLEGNTNR